MAFGSYFNQQALRDALTGIDRVLSLLPHIKVAADDAKLFVKNCKSLGKRAGDVFELLTEMKKPLEQGQRAGICPPDAACLENVGEALDACHEVMCKLKTSSKLLLIEHAPQIVEQFRDVSDKLQASVLAIPIQVLNMPHNICDRVQNIGKWRKPNAALEKSESAAHSQLHAIRQSHKRGQANGDNDKTREQVLKGLNLTTEEAKASESRALQLEKARLQLQLSDLHFHYSLLRKFDNSRGTHWGVDASGDDVKIGTFERNSWGELRLQRIRLLRRSIHLTTDTESREHIEKLLISMGLGSEEAREAECRALSQDRRTVQSQIRNIDFLNDFLRCGEAAVEQLREPFPQRFVCPLAQERMHEPVVVASQETYERAYIDDWLHKKQKRVCPKTKIRLGNVQLSPNFGLRAEIRLWCLQNGHDAPLKLHGEALSRLISNWISWFIENGEDVHKLAVLSAAVRSMRSARVRRRSEDLENTHVMEIAERGAAGSPETTPRDREPSFHQGDKPFKQTSHSHRSPSLEKVGHIYQDGYGWIPDPRRKDTGVSVPSPRRQCSDGHADAHRGGDMVCIREGESVKVEVDGTPDRDDDDSGSSSHSISSGQSREAAPSEGNGAHNLREDHSKVSSRRFSAERALPDDSRAITKHGRSLSGEMNRQSCSSPVHSIGTRELPSNASPGRKSGKKPVSFVPLPTESVRLYNPLGSSLGTHLSTAPIFNDRTVHQGPKEGSLGTRIPSPQHVMVDTRNVASTTGSLLHSSGERGKQQSAALTRDYAVPSADVSESSQVVTSLGESGHSVVSGGPEGANCQRRLESEVRVHLLSPDPRGCTSHIVGGGLEHQEVDSGAQEGNAEDTRQIINTLEKLEVSVASEKSASGDTPELAFPLQTLEYGTEIRVNDRRPGDVIGHDQGVCRGESGIDLLRRKDAESPSPGTHSERCDSKEDLKSMERDVLGSSGFSMRADGAANALGWQGDDASDALKIGEEEVSTPKEIFVLTGKTDMTGKASGKSSAPCSVRSRSRSFKGCMSRNSEAHLEVEEGNGKTPCSSDSACPVDVTLSSSQSCTSRAEPSGDGSTSMDDKEELRVPSAADVELLVHQAHPVGRELWEQPRAIKKLREMTKSRAQCRVLVCELGGVELMEAIFRKVQEIERSCYGNQRSHISLDANWVQMLEDVVATALNVSIEQELKIRIATSTVLPHLVRLLDEAPTEEIREITVETFRSLSRDDNFKSQDLIREKGGIPALIRVLQRENRTSDVESAVLKTLSALSVQDQNRLQMSSEGIIPIALKIAQQPGNPVAYLAVSVVHNLMSVRAARVKVVEFDGVSILFGVIQRKEGELTVENAVAILYCIACSSEWLQSEVAKVRGIVDVLKQVISDPNSRQRAKTKATYLLRLPMLKNRMNGAEVARLHALNEDILHER